MGVPIFLYSFFTSKEINNINQWFWLETINKFFSKKQGFLFCKRQTGSQDFVRNLTAFNFIVKIITQLWHKYIKITYHIEVPYFFLNSTPLLFFFLTTRGEGGYIINLYVYSLKKETQHVKKYNLLQIFNIILNTEISITLHWNLAHWLFRLQSSLKWQTVSQRISPIFLLKSLLQFLQSLRRWLTTTHASIQIIP